MVRFTRLLPLLLLVLLTAPPLLRARDALARTGLPQPAPKRPLARSPASHRLLTHTRVCVRHDHHGRCMQWALTRPHPSAHATTSATASADARAELP